MALFIDKVIFTVCDMASESGNFKFTRKEGVLRLRFKELGLETSLSVA